MAVSFSSADLPMLANLSQAHPSPQDFWEWVRTHTASSELQEIAVFHRDAWAAVAHTPIGEQIRLANAVQELQAVEQTLELTREEDSGQGKVVVAHLVSTVAAV